MFPVAVYVSERLNRAAGSTRFCYNERMQSCERIELQGKEVEAHWLEICPFESNRQILFGGICPHL